MLSFTSTCKVCFSSEWEESWKENGLLILKFCIEWKCVVFESYYSWLHQNPQMLKIYSNIFYPHQGTFNVNSTAFTHSGAVIQQKRGLYNREPCTM